MRARGKHTGGNDMEAVRSNSLTSDTQDSVIGLAGMHGLCFCGICPLLFVKFAHYNNKALINSKTKVESGGRVCRNNSPHCPLNKTANATDRSVMLFDIFRYKASWLICRRLNHESLSSFLLALLWSPPKPCCPSSCRLCRCYRTLFQAHPRS